MDKKHQKGIFGTIYTEFKQKPKDAIKHLMKKKEGECKDAFYREDVGYVSVVWGFEGTEEKAYKDGYGLSHIIKVHKNEFEQLNFKIEDFICMIFTFGKLSPNKNRIYLKGETFNLVITTEWLQKPKKIILTAFDLRSIESKNPKRAKKIKRKAN